MLDDELRTLEQKAIKIAQIQNPGLRHQLGLKLNHELEQFERHYHPLSPFISSDVQVSFRAVVKILFDYILHDALEDKDWIAAVPKPKQSAEDVLKDK